MKQTGMQRFGLPGAVLMMAVWIMATLGSTQMMAQPDPQMGMHGAQSQGVVPSSRTMFGAECGIRDTSTQSALAFARSAEGEWSAVSAERGGGSNDDMVARLWRETNWMVDLHGALGQGMSVMHTGQLCFDGQGRITRMIDRYMAMAQCGCMRFTALTFAPDGRATRREQRFVSVATGVEIAEPDVAQDFPPVWEFRRVEQLPFYSLLKK